MHLEKLKQVKFKIEGVLACLAWNDTYILH